MSGRPTPLLSLRPSVVLAPLGRGGASSIAIGAEATTLPPSSPLQSPTGMLIAEITADITAKLHARIRDAFLRVTDKVGQSFSRPTSPTRGPRDGLFEAGSIASAVGPVPPLPAGWVPRDSVDATLFGSARQGAGDGGAGAGAEAGAGTASGMSSARAHHRLAELLPGGEVSSGRGGSAATFLTQIGEGSA